MERLLLIYAVDLLNQALVTTALVATDIKLPYRKFYKFDVALRYVTHFLPQDI